MTIDERIQALAMTLELIGHEVQTVLATAKQDGENIRALAEIAEVHERRLTDPEGQ